MNDSLCAVFFHLFYDVSENNLSVSKYSNARRLNKSFFFSKEKKNSWKPPSQDPLSCCYNWTRCCLGLLHVCQPRTSHSLILPFPVSAGSNCSIGVLGAHSFSSFLRKGITEDPVLNPCMSENFTLPLYLIKSYTRGVPWWSSS